MFSMYHTSHTEINIMSLHSNILTDVSAKKNINHNLVLLSVSYFRSW